MSDVKSLLEPIQLLHREIRSRVVSAQLDRSVADMARVSREAAEDTIYEIDRVSEDVILSVLEKAIAPEAPVLLIAEGLSEREVVLPRGADRSSVAWRVIIDPIDGTRGLMYQKRSAWILTGVAPNKGADTTLGDVALAVQTEIPLVKQYLSDELWAVKDQGAHATRYNRLTDESEPLELAPSSASTIAHGFAMLARFFPGAREELAAIDEEVVRGAVGEPGPGKALCFEDQYLSTGGQLYELVAGHDRFVADLRPLMNPVLAEKGLGPGLCCHPYDLCTALIAREFGVVVTDANGKPHDAPLTIDADVAWVGYANASIRSQVEPLLLRALRRRGLIESS